MRLLRNKHNVSNKREALALAEKMGMGDDTIHQLQAELFCVTEFAPNHKFTHGYRSASDHLEPLYSFPGSTCHSHYDRSRSVILRRSGLHDLSEHFPYD